MFNRFNQLLPQSYNQTDRIQGMARYMNQDGANSEVMTLLLIFAGMLTVILILRMVARHNQRKREAALKKRMEQKQRAQKQAAAQANARAKSNRRVKTRL
jgi:hypothetical protein